MGNQLRRNESHSFVFGQARSLSYEVQHAAQLVLRKALTPAQKNGALDTSMPIEFLTQDEICQLTGARTKAGQVRVLKQNGIRHYIKMNGWPAVTVHAVTGEQTKEPAPITWKSNKMP